MNQSVIKALKILDLFSEERAELSLKEVSDLSGLPKPTAYRFLQSLETTGLIMKVEENESSYRLGLKLLELGQLVSHQLDLRQMAKPLMRRLAKSINEAVHLVVVHGDQATYIEKVDSQRALRLFTHVGKSVPLHIGSGPKLLLAYLNEERQKSILDKELYSFTQERIIDKDALIEDLNGIKERGFSISVSEQDIDTTGVSYPIFDHNGEVIAALTVSGLSSHFEGENLILIKKEMKAIAKEISFCLGYSTQQEEGS